MEKRRDLVAQDLISELPDGLLLHILSFLPFKDLLKTSVLAKRWKDIWSHVPSLVLEPSNGVLEDPRFVEGVDSFLPYCDTTSIERFNIGFHYYYRFKSSIDSWLQFAVDKKVRDLSLTFRRTLYVLPTFLYFSQSLTNLALRCCKVTISEDVSWTSLTSISMRCTKFHDDTTAKLFRGCPKLESLTVIDCSGFQQLDIKSETLKKLVIKFTSSKYGAPLEISAPCLLHLHIQGSIERRVRLNNLLSLRRAKLEFSLEIDDNVDRYTSDFYDWHCYYFLEILESIGSVVELEMGPWCVEALIFLETTTFSSEFSSLTCLKLTSYMNISDGPGIITLLKLTPNLETLEINATNRSSLNQWRSFKLFVRASEFWKRIRKLPLAHLKNVRFHGFKDKKDADMYIHKLVQLLESSTQVDCLIG